MVFNLIKNYKTFSDIIYGNISVSNLALEIIDSHQYQRLRKINQLGICNIVFPCASHKRFEHGIGTYHLAGKMLDTIKYSNNDVSNYLKNIPELKEYFNTNKIELDDYICELIKIAALCHDIGHGPFSHLFDDVIVINEESENKLHEVRSQIIIEDIIINNKFLRNIITDNEIKFIKSLINPKKNNTGFIYQIISNNFNGLDVDKYDYIIRDSFMLGNKIDFDFSVLINDIKVIDDTICYNESSLFQIIKMYNTRYSLHKEKYTHKTVISAQFLIIELIKCLDEFIGIKSSINNLEHFYKLTDEYIFNAVYFLELINKDYNENIMKAKYILNLLNKRKLYPLICKKTSDKSINLDINKIRELEGYDNKFDNKILIFNSKIGYVSGDKKNPLKYIYSYNENNEKKKIDIKTVSYLIPKIYQEYITYVYYTDIDDSESINKLRIIMNA